MAVAKTWCSLLLGISLSACFGRPIPPGPGKLSTQSSKRLKAEETAAKIEAVHRACETAAANPSDQRMQLKAAALATECLTEKLVAPATVMQWVAPALSRLDTDACGAKLQVAAVFMAAGDRGSAVTRYVEFARSCGNVDAALAAAPMLRELRRCDEVPPLFATLWPTTPNSRWLAIFDEIAACSSEVSLRPNLAFVPADVRQDYLALREKRERQEEERRKEAAQEKRERDARAREDARDASCVSDCNNSAWECRRGCDISDMTCSSNCNAIGNLCSSRCHR